MYKLIFKRFLDLALSIPAFICFSPFLFLAYITVKLTSKGPFFFFQERLGKKGRIIRVIKIRTMVHAERTPNREILKGDAEVTKVGYFLRRLKIDEMPQVLNVINGDMSLVGPRPGLPSQLPEFNEDGRARLTVKPGLTGLAQVNGNIHLTWPERWKYDRYYAENLSFGLDVRIIFKTFLIIILGEHRFLKHPDA